MKQGLETGTSRCQVESRPRRKGFREVLFIPHALQMCDFSSEVVTYSKVIVTISRLLKITLKTEKNKTSLLGRGFRRNILPHCSLFSVFQVRWHGAKNNRGEGVWVHMLSERGAGHRLACPCHSVKLQPHLPPKPAGRETTSAEGTDSPPSSFSISPYCASICPFFLCPCLIRT